MAQQIVVDPITRIEGHLRIECEVDDGQITNARSIGTMWRGIENILKGRDPREAWIIAQRICGVCTTVHGLASVRAVENALNLEIPVNAHHFTGGTHLRPEDRIDHGTVLAAESTEGKDSLLQGDGPALVNETRILGGQDPLLAQRRNRFTHLDECRSLREGNTTCLRRERNSS